MMSPEEAEKQIRHLVAKIDTLRRREMSESDREAAIQQAEQEIRDLKKITGPRHITGRFRG